MQDARFVLPRNAPSITRNILRSGDKLPFSPISLIDPIGGGGGSGGGHVKKPKSKIDLGYDYDSYKEYGDSHDTNHHRDLGGSNDNQQQSYLVDSSGTAYEPYSLAWRYLGMYIDCDYDPAAASSSSSYEDDEYEGHYDRRRNTRTRRRTTGNDTNTTNADRQRSLGGDSGDSGDGDCERVLLWAAYHDPKYKGGSIGEYKYFDLTTGEWDDSHCHTKRCVRMDCHEPNTHFKLVGVFKESDGLVDWAEQLFKHEGYCIWDEDQYEVMQTQREQWPTECVKLYYSDSSGNTLYHHLQPEREGNITLGIYTDSACTQVSQTTTFFDYIVIWYTNYYYGTQGQAENAISYWNETITSWNEYMTPYKICQPCRAYDIRDDDEEESGSQSGSGSGDRDLRRHLGGGNNNNNNDGEGDAEQWGYDCYDAAGYTNCNQCYKFETKTDMTICYTEDLQRASTQDTILAIRFEGKVYGSGGYTSTPELFVFNLDKETVALLGGVCLVLVGVIFFFCRWGKTLGTGLINLLSDIGDRFRRIGRRRRSRRRRTKKVLAIENGPSGNNDDNVNERSLVVYSKPQSNDAESESSVSVSTSEEESSEEEEEEDAGQTLTIDTTGGKDGIIRIQIGRSALQNKPKNKKMPKAARKKTKKDAASAPAWDLTIPAFSLRKAPPTPRTAIAALAYDHYQHLEYQEERQRRGEERSIVSAPASRRIQGNGATGEAYYEEWNTYRPLEDEEGETRSIVSAPPPRRVQEDGVFKIDASRTKEAPPREATEAWDNYRSLEDAIAPPAIACNAAAISGSNEPAINVTSDTSTSYNVPHDSELVEAWGDYRSLDENDGATLTVLGNNNASTVDGSSASNDDSREFDSSNACDNTITHARGNYSSPDGEGCVTGITTDATAGDEDTVGCDGHGNSEIDYGSDAGKDVAIESSVSNDALKGEDEATEHAAPNDHVSEARGGATDMESSPLIEFPVTTDLRADEDAPATPSTTTGNEACNSDLEDIIANTGTVPATEYSAPNDNATADEGSNTPAIESSALIESQASNSFVDIFYSTMGLRVAEDTVTEHSAPNDNDTADEATEHSAPNDNATAEEGSNTPAIESSALIESQASKSFVDIFYSTMGLRVAEDTATEQSAPNDTDTAEEGSNTPAIDSSALIESQAENSCVDIFYSTMGLGVAEDTATSTPAASASVDRFYSTRDLREEEDSTPAAATTIAAENEAVNADTPVADEDLVSRTARSALQEASPPSNSGDIFFSCMSLDAATETSDAAEKRALAAVEYDETQIDVSALDISRVSENDDPRYRSPDLVSGTIDESPFVHATTRDAAFSTTAGEDESINIDFTTSHDTSRASQSACSAWDNYIRFKNSEAAVLDVIESQSAPEPTQETTHAVLNTDSLLTLTPDISGDDDMSQTSQERQQPQHIPSNIDSHDTGNSEATDADPWDKYSSWAETDESRASRDSTGTAAESTIAMVDNIQSSADTLLPIVDSGDEATTQLQEQQQEPQEHASAVGSLVVTSADVVTSPAQEQGQDHQQVHMSESQETPDVNVSAAECTNFWYGEFFGKKD